MSAPSGGSSFGHHANTETSSAPPNNVHDVPASSGRHQDHDEDVAGEEQSAAIKVEDVSDFLTTDATASTLRPAPQPSAKRRESEAGDSATPELGDGHKHKKRKRGPSPAWNFPSAETSFVKTADGRRVSARVNTSTDTPGMSEAEDVAVARARSNSQLTTTPRASSPPWKKFEAQGPTTVQVDGVRKSGRVNKELVSEGEAKPLRVSPRQKQKQVDAMASDTPAKSSKDTRPRSPSSKIRELKAQIAALKPSRSFHSEEAEDAKSPHKRKRSNDVGPHDQNQLQSPRPTSPTTTRKMHSQSTARPRALKITIRPNTRRVIPPPHPQATFGPPARPPRPSLYHILEQYEFQEAQQPYLENERGPPDAAWLQKRRERIAVEEAQSRQRILKEAEPGGVLSHERAQIFQPDTQTLPQATTHLDHLTAHALRLRSAGMKAKNARKNLAKKLSQEALEYWRRVHGPTRDDVEAEQMKVARLVYKQVVVDIRAKWEMVSQHVGQLRRQEWEAAEEVKRQERLKEKLEWSEAMVARQRGEAGSVSVDGDGDVEMEDVDVDDEESGEEENMSSVSGSEADEDEDVGGEMSEEQLRNYHLAQQQAALSPPQVQLTSPAAGDALDSSDTPIAEPDSGLAEPSPRPDGPADEDAHDEDQDDDFTPALDSGDDGIAAAADVVEETDANQATVQTHFSTRAHASPEPSEAVLDDDDFSSDESVEMIDSDESDEDEDEEEEESDEEEDEPGPNLLSLFNDVKAFKDAKPLLHYPTPTTSAEDDGQEAADEHDDDGLPSMHAGAGTQFSAADIMMQDSAQDTTTTSPHPIDSVVPASAPRSPESAASPSNTRSLVPIPMLLRGTLRSYQHAGVDWLASLYRAGTNGILADEMGLGKTIQTIALLAHLAEECEVWKPHLVIVPTSVILNWVTEFQKFLPGFRVLAYFGSADERQRKRKGWVNDPHHEVKEKRGYNVVVTSYNIAMHDNNAMRNVQWHYLVLDEAHNIRNFNSQTWQTLIRLKTKARLMLTGTPLQNSLTELWALLTFLTAGDDNPRHGDLEEFLGHWKEPVKEIFDRGVSRLSNESQKVVEQLHISLRPFLLRRLKSEVEKDLPSKIERVVVCKLSKRQRQLYEEYMSLASTKQALMRGSGISAGRVLMALRRVCNHPDLFDPRSIQTSFAMERGVSEGFVSKEDVVRRLLGVKETALEGLMVVAREGKRGYAVKRSQQLDGTGLLKRQLLELETSTPAEMPLDLSSMAGAVVLQRLRQREKKLQQLRDGIRTSEAALQHNPVYGADLRELLTIQHGRPYYSQKRVPPPPLPQLPPPPPPKFLRGWPSLGNKPLAFEDLSDWLITQSTALQKDVLDLTCYGQSMQDTITRFAFCPPVATAPLLDSIISPHAQKLLRASPAYPNTSTPDFAHEARIRTAINFPDKRLLIYDAGKLQRLTSLLRELQSKGSRSLIFTQSTATLDILEQFLSLLNLPYLRLDGSTHVERRQLYALEFNRLDSKYQVMILSSRAGGVGLNLIGASSVIFYDLDWNPQMDRQCMDRAHRIGQVKDVEVFKLVSEKTIEENILRRAGQKSLLDQTVIQEGNFTTDYQQPAAVQEEPAEAEDKDVVGAAMYRLLGAGNGDEKTATQALESVEEKEDVQAAQQARREERGADDADFGAEGSRSKGASAAPTPGPSEEEMEGHVDGYMVRWMQELMRDVTFVPPVARKADRHGRDPSHRPKRKR